MAVELEANLGLFLVLPFFTSVNFKDFLRGCEIFVQEVHKIR